MTARVHVEYDPLRRGVRIHAMVNDRLALDFTEPALIHVEDNGQHLPADPLTIPDDVARALYESLAEHYGHSGHDTRALRRDYDHERGRVDKLLDHLMGLDR